MKKLFILFLILFNAFLFGSTTITDGQNVSGTWDTNGSPYIIQGEAIVPQNSTLTINPGVVVKFDTGTDFDYTGGIDMGLLRVQGTLNACGTADNRITFTRNGDSGSWSLIYFDSMSNTANNIIQYAIVEYADHMNNLGPLAGYKNMIGAVSSYQSGAEISYCEFRYNLHAIYGCYADIEITNNHIHHQTWHGPLYKYSNFTVENNLIEDNGGFGVYADRGSTTVIRNNIIQNNGDIGIECKYDNADIIGNLIYNNTNYGILCFSSSPNVFNNTIADNGGYGGIAVYSNSSLTIKNCILYGNNADFYKYSYYTGTTTVSYTSLAGASLPVYLSNGGNNTFNENPDFTNYASGDFTLTYDSPCINAGTPTTTGMNLPDEDYDGTPRIVQDTVDMGAYEFPYFIINDQDEITYNLTLDDSPYLVLGAATIPSGNTVTISAGAEIYMKTGTDFDYSGGVDVGMLYVSGLIDANGTSANNIKFTRYGDTGNWGQIYINSNSANSLEYCDIQYGKQINNINGDNHLGAVSFHDDADGEVSYCSFSNNYHALAVWDCDATTIDITNSTFDNNTYHAIIGYNAELNIEENEISNNGGIGIYSEQYSSSIVRSNVIYNNGDCGIEAKNSGNLDIINNLLYDNTKAEILCFAATADIYNNTITGDCVKGVYIVGSTASVVMKNNIIYMENSNPATYNDSGAGSGSAWNNLISDASFDTGITNQSGNIFDDDPEFTNAASDIYTLVSTSPCINAGTASTTGLNLPSLDLNGNTRVVNTVDIGAYEYQTSITDASSQEQLIAGKFKSSVAPNPFNPVTTINYSIPASQHVSIEVYNIRGQKVTNLVNETQESGSHSVVWNAEGSASGIYFITIESGSQKTVEKLILMK